jgi:hypothetical protein
MGHQPYASRAESPTQLAVSSSSTCATRREVRRDEPSCRLKQFQPGHKRGGDPPLAVESRDLNSFILIATFSR